MMSVIMDQKTCKLSQEIDWDLRKVVVVVLVAVEVTEYERQVEQNNLC